MSPDKPAPEPNYLQIIDLVKDFGGGAVAVNPVSLSLAKGEIFALLGPSGCGKTTLLRMLGGFETPTSGRIVLGGQDLGDLPPYERPINMMFQSYALFPHLTKQSLKALRTWRRPAAVATLGGKSCSWCFGGEQVLLQPLLTLI